MNYREFETYYEQQMQYRKDMLENIEWYIARVCSIIANVNRDTKKRKKPYTEKDFISKHKIEKQTVEQQEIMLKALTLAMGGEIDG